MYCVCCGVPTAVSSACSMSGCEDSSTDGTNLTLTTISGGTSSLAADATWGRPGPGAKITSNQSSTPGVYSTVTLSTAVDTIGCISPTICAEFLMAVAGTSLDVWPCIVQGADVFVPSSTGLTDITSSTTWNGRSYTPGVATGNWVKVTAFNSSSITVGTTKVDGFSSGYIGFLIRSDGTSGVDCIAYMDNVCLNYSRPCPNSNCTTVTVVLSGFSIDAYDALQLNCDIDSTLAGNISSAINGTYLCTFETSISNDYYWYNGAILTADTLIYDSGGNKAWLIVEPNWNSSTGDPQIYLKCVIQPSGCGSAYTEFECVYDIARASFSCGSSLTYDFATETPVNPTHTLPSTISATWNSL